MDFAAYRAWTWMMVIIAWGANAGTFAAAQSSDLDARRARALASFDAVLRADDTLTQRTRDDLAAVLAARPEDAFTRVHLGWLLVLSARTLPLAAARQRALEGCALMDVAVAAAPADAAVRFVRARSDSQMPLALGRESQAVVDFTQLVAAVRDRAPRAANSMTPEMRREILFHAGAFALRRRRPTEAVGLLEEAARVAADRPSPDDVQSMLALARQELSSQGHGETPDPGYEATTAP